MLSWIHGIGLKGLDLATMLSYSSRVHPSSLVDPRRMSFDHLFVDML